MPVLTRFPLSEVLTKLPQGNLKEKVKGTLFAFHRVLVQLLSLVQLFVTPWAAARQAPLSSALSQSLLRFMSIDSVVPSSHFILWCPLLLLTQDGFFFVCFVTSSMSSHLRLVQIFVLSSQTVLSPCNFLSNIRHEVLGERNSCQQDFSVGFNLYLARI